MRRNARNRLPRWQRQFIYATTALLTITGIGWLIVCYLLAPGGEPTPAPHPWAPTLLGVHGIAAYLSLAGLGIVSAMHMRVGWQREPQRVIGVVLCSVFALLVITGLAFYYFVSDATRPLLRDVHIVAGFALPLMLVWHILRGRGLANPHRSAQRH